MSLWNNVEDPYDPWNGRQPDDPGYNQGTGAYVGGAPAPPVATTPAPATTPAVEPEGGGKGGAAAAFAPSGYPGTQFTKPVPKFTAPVFGGRFEAPIFNRPSAADVFNAPGYQFRVDQGQQGIERSAAARGLLRTGGTLKDIADYNQNFASNEYGNEFNRAYQTYETQYRGKLDEFKSDLQGFQTNYQGRKDEYAPLLAEWSTLANADLQRALAAYGRDTIWYNPNAGGGGGGYREEWNEDYPDDERT